MPRLSRRRRSSRRRIAGRCRLGHCAPIVATPEGVVEVLELQSFWSKCVEDYDRLPSARCSSRRNFRFALHVPDRCSRRPAFGSWLAITWRHHFRYEFRRSRWRSVRANVLHVVRYGRSRGRSGSSIQGAPGAKAIDQKRSTTDQRGKNSSTRRGRRPISGGRAVSTRRGRRSISDGFSGNRSKADFSRDRKTGSLRIQRGPDQPRIQSGDLINLDPQRAPDQPRPQIQAEGPSATAGTAATCTVEAFAAAGQAEQQDPPK